MNVRYVATVVLGLALMSGCADSGNDGSNGRPLTMQQRQDAALRDPFGVGGNTDKVDISGGGLGEYNKKAMKRDVDSVLNP